MRSQKKPCPECGEIDIFRKTGEICRECKRLIRKAREIESKENKDETKVFVRFSSTPHWNEYLHAPGDFDGREVMKIFVRLALSCSSVALSNGYASDDFPILGKPDHSQRYTMSKETAEAIRDLRSIMDTLIPSVYAQGKKDGSNLLLRLASGDLAPNEWIEKTEEVRGAKEES